MFYIVKYILLVIKLCPLQFDKYQMP